MTPPYSAEHFNANKKPYVHGPGSDMYSSCHTVLERPTFQDAEEMARAMNKAYAEGYAKRGTVIREALGCN